jgi:RNA polymerase primary sigma factor
MKKKMKVQKSSKYATDKVPELKKNGKNHTAPVKARAAGAKSGRISVREHDDQVEADLPEAIGEILAEDAEDIGPGDKTKIEVAELDKREPSKDSLMLYFDEIRNEKILTEQEEKDIIKRAQRGEPEARVRIIKANLKLVVKIAKRYEYFGVPLIDLIEEGNIGLMKAVEKFKPELGFRFSTYGTWWIKQSINRAIANQKNTIRIPVHILDIYHKYLKQTEKEIKNTGRVPDKYDVAAKLKIDPTKLNEILNIIKAPKSLDLEYDSEDSDTGRTLKDVIEDISVSKPDDDFFEKDKNEKIMELISKLKPKEQEVIINRFGINNRNILTLEEIGDKLKLTRERIRQIEAMAIKKLRYLMKNTEN